MKIKKHLIFLFLFLMTLPINASTGEGVSKVGTLSSITYGTTVIVHGLNPDENYSLYQAQNWTLTMAKAIAMSKGNGQVYTISNGVVSFENDYSVGTGGEKIIVWDWLLTSQLPKFGFAEAAGDALAAILINEASKTNPLWNLNNIHFIGHSRGAFVSSEAIQRLGIYANEANINIDQNINFTTLDAHPWDYISILGTLYSAKDNDVNGKVIDFGVVGWENVKYADNYWHITDNVIDLDGLRSIPAFVMNKNLTQQTDKYKDMSHGNVHAWYHGTIDTLASNDGAYTSSDGVIHSLKINDSNDWYPDNERYELGFNIDMNNILITSGIKLTADKTFDIGTIFNGNFQMVPANQKVIIHNFPGKIITPITPGWVSHGGGGTGHIGGYLNLIYFTVFNPHLELDRNNEKLTHNYFFIPKSASKIYFRLKVFNKTTNGDFLVANIGSKTIKIFSLTQKHQFVWESIDIPSEYKGTASTLTFKIITGGNVADSEVHIDDINFKEPQGINTLFSFSSQGGNISPGEANLLSNKNSTKTISVGEVHIYDYLNRHTGKINDSTWVTEIPNSKYYVDIDSLGKERIQIYLPKSENDYRIEVKSKSDNTVYPNNKLDLNNNGDLISYPKDRIRYSNSIRENMYNKIKNKLSINRGITLRLAAETPDMWDKIGLDKEKHIAKSVKQ